MYYNGVTHAAALAGPVNGTHRWVEAGGIAGRGVLLDWLSWREKTKGEAPPPHARHEIRVGELDEVARAQGVTLRQGDILMIRSGYVRWHKYFSLSSTSPHRYGADTMIVAQPPKPAKKAPKAQPAPSASKRTTRPSDGSLSTTSPPWWATPSRLRRGRRRRGPWGYMNGYSRAGGRRLARCGIWRR